MQMKITHHLALISLSTSSAAQKKSAKWRFCIFSVYLLCDST